MLRILNAPNFKEILIGAIEQGGIAEAAISSMIETIHSMIDTSLFSVTN